MDNVIKIWRDGNGGWYVCLDVKHDTLVLIEKNIPCRTHEYESKFGARKAAKRISKALNIPFVESSL